MADEQDEAIALARVDTRRMPLTEGDRLIFENRWEQFEKQQKARENERDKMRHDFYETRMIPLEQKAARLDKELTVRSWITLAIAGFALLLGLVSVLIIVWLHAR